MFQCPQCHSPLVEAPSHLTCDSCGTTTPIVDGVVAFSDTSEFYDAYADLHCQFQASPSPQKQRILRVLPAWSWREWRFLRAAVPAAGKILEIGCGRGRELFTGRNQGTIGIETSMAAARECATRYERVALTLVPPIPFADNSFNAVVSAHLLGHISSDDKDETFAEIARVLKTGGTTAHIIETDSTHRAVVAAKSHPSAYRERFVDQHGHIGLELAPLVLARFEAHGLTVTRCDLVEAILPSVLNYRSVFNHPDLERGSGLRTTRFLDRVTKRSGVLNAAYEVGMGAYHHTIEQWVGRPEKAQYIHVVATKR